jgi:hypothetical protein
MKKLNCFFIIICVCTLKASQKPLDGKISSYYEPEMKKAFEKKDKDRVVKLCALDPKLFTTVQALAQKDNSGWGKEILTGIAAIQKARVNRVEALTDLEKESLAKLQSGHKIAHGTVNPDSTAAKARL